MRIRIAVALFTGALAFAQNTEPSRQEIADAYRSKTGEGGTAFSGLRWEKWRVRQVRGWSLKFKRLSEQNALGVLTRRYQAIAMKNGQCAEYQVVEVALFPPVHAKGKPGLTVQPGGVSACR